MTAELPSIASRMAYFHGICPRPERRLGLRSNAGEGRLPQF